jgi:hypothetical protein
MTSSLIILLVLVSLLAGCAARAPRSAPVAPELELSEAAGKLIVAQWQKQLGNYIAQEGNGDLTVLGQLPALRSPGLRPARITFGAIDIEASVPERDGFDVQGQLLGKQETTFGAWYVFIVGIVERGEYRPTTIADIRVAAMSGRESAMVWETGASDVQELRRYRHAANAALPLRFPADTDRFTMSSCAPGICVIEHGSGARWSLYFRTASSP